MMMMMITRSHFLFSLPVVLSLAVACSDSSSSSSGGDGASSSSSSSSGGASSGQLGGASSGGPSSTSSSGGSNGGTSSGDTEPPPIPYVDYNINHVLFTGQSNSVANSGTPVLSTTQPYENLMFNTGVMPSKFCDGAGCKAYDTPSGFAPLVEGDKFFNYGVETASSGIANEITFLGNDGKYQKPNHQVLISLHGRSGNTYWCLRMGGCDYKPGYLHPFEQGMMEVTSAKQLAQAAGKSYVVRAVVTIHGESDHYSYTDGSQEFPIPGSDGTPGKIKDYADGMIEWQQDYEASVKAITNQKEGVPLFMSQISGWNDTQYSRVAQYQLDAHVRAPGKVFLIGPSYHLAIASDCRHFTADGERHLGEYFAKVYARVIFEGRQWEPVRPKDVTRNGTNVTVSFHVPSPPLVFDTDKVAAAANMGFLFKSAAGADVPISNVAIAGPDSVTVTLASDPGPGGHLTYAQNQVAHTCIGTPAGARGNLRDSDKTPSRAGYDLSNWAVHFDVAVP